MWNLINLVLISLHLVTSSTDVKIINAVGIAISDIINENSAKHSQRFTLTILGDELILKSFAESVLKYVVYPIEINKFSNNVNLSSDVNIPRIILASEPVKFDLYLVQPLDYYSPSTNAMTYVYYWKNDKTLEIENIKNTVVHSLAEHRVMYFINNIFNNSIEIIGLLQYQKGDCDMKLTKINRFSINELKWESKEFIKTYTSFNNCTIGMLTTNNRMMMKVFDNEGRRTETIDETNHLAYTFSGIYGDLLNVYAEKHKINILLQNNPADKSIELTILYSYEHLRKKFGYHLTPSVYQHELTFMVHRGLEPTPFEKLILPFDDITWYLVIGTMILGYLTIFIVYQLPQYVQEIVFNNRNPSLGLTQIFFGIGLINSPEKLFARLLFLLFTMYCLVIRTAYQGKMFDFLHFHVRKPGLESVDEVLDSSVPIYNGGNALVTYLTDKM